MITIFPAAPRAVRFYLFPFPLIGEGLLGAKYVSSRFDNYISNTIRSNIASRVYNNTGEINARIPSANNTYVTCMYSSSAANLDTLGSHYFKSNIVRTGV